MKELSEASWSRISISREGFRPGGQGAGGGGGQQRGGGQSGCEFTRWSLRRGHRADRPTGLRRGGWSEGLTPRAHGRHVCSRPDPPSWRMGSSATVGTKGLGDKPAVP